MNSTRVPRGGSRDSPSTPQPRAAETKALEQLRSWAARQRKAHAEGKLSPERVEALHQLKGWSWTPPAQRGPTALQRLRRRLAREVEGSSSSSSAASPAAAAHENGGGGFAYARCPSVGRALVVSVGARREDGAESECVDAREALRSLGYEVVTVQNPTASELSASLIAHAERDGWEAHGSSVVALMAHGHDAKLEGQDGESASLQALFGLLAPANAPSLAGKPKIFLVQACRRGERRVLVTQTPPPPGKARSAGRGSASADGGMFDTAVEGDGDGDAADAADAADASQFKHVEEHDFIWAYATTPGTVAYRGALFAAFRQVVEENGCGTSWIELLQLTNERLSKWSACREDRHALPSMEISSTCRGRAFAPADLYFAEEAERVEVEDGEEDEEEMGAEEVAQAAAAVRISSGRRKGSWNRKL